MAAPSTVFKVEKKTEEAIILFALKGQQLLTNQWSMRPQLEEIDRSYSREKDWTLTNIKGRIDNRRGDADKVQNVTVPIVMPQVESALAYFINVFVTGYPTFGVATDPSASIAAQQMEAIMAENAVTAGWARQLSMFFRDGLKYNLHGLEIEWVQRTVANVETDASAPNSARPKKSLWHGNVMKRMDLYNTFFDPRVHPAEIHSQGEFAGYTDIFPRTRLKKYLNELYGKIAPATVIRAFESSPSAEVVTTTTSPFGYYVPLINPEPLMNRNNIQSFDWMAWAVNTAPTYSGIRYGNVYHMMKMYARIIPADFGLDVPEPNTPQVWKFIIVNGSVVIIAERQTNAHEYIPIFFGQPIEDGLDYQTKSFATNVKDLQAVASAMWNGYLASKRRLVGDRVLYDPSRVREKDINSVNPAAKIPVRPDAYGKPVSDAVFAFPYRDEATTTMVQTAQQVVAFANTVNGQNAAQQGQFTKGNRTKHEYDDIMGHGNDHNQLMAITTEGQVFVPAKEVLKLNILQYQPDAIVFNPIKQQGVKVSGVDLRKEAVHFKISDGLLPEDKIIDGDDLQNALVALAQNPSLAAGFNQGPLFSYLMGQRGADLTPFQKSPLQMQYEQQMNAWQQAAAGAAKAGTPFSSPQPQPSPQLQQEMQQMQQNGGVLPNIAVLTALESTQGDLSAGNTQPSGGQPGGIAAPPVAPTPGVTAAPIGTVQRPTS